MRISSRISRQGGLRGRDGLGTVGLGQVGAVALLIVAGLVGPARGAPQAPVDTPVSNTCNGITFISYPNPPDNNFAGTTDHVQLQIGSGPIDGGTTLTVSQILFDLSCRHRGCSNDFNQPCT